jgi:hypothetical protein
MLANRIANEASPRSALDALEEVSLLAVALGPLCRLGCALSSHAHNAIYRGNIFRGDVRRNGAESL